MWPLCLHERRLLSALELHNEPCKRPLIEIVPCDVLAAFRIIFHLWDRWQAPQPFKIPSMWDRIQLQRQRKVWPHKVQQGKSLLVCSSCSRTEVVLSLPALGPKCQCGLLGDCVTQHYKIVIIGVDLTPRQKAFCWDLKAPVMHKHLLLRYSFTVGCYVIPELLDSITRLCDAR